MSLLLLFGGGVPVVAQPLPAVIQRLPERAPPPPVSPSQVWQNPHGGSRTGQPGAWHGPQTIIVQGTSPIRLPESVPSPAEAPNPEAVFAFPFLVPLVVPIERGAAVSGLFPVYGVAEVAVPAAPGEVKLLGILVNTFAECPPLAMFPRKARDADMAETGAEAQEAWSYAQLPRRHISAKYEVHVWEPGGGAQWTASMAGMPSGWVGTQHSHVVTNSESSFDFKTGPKTIATGRPWHGNFSVPRDAGNWPTLVNWLSRDVSPRRRHAVAVADDSDAVYIGISPNTRDLAYEEVAAGFDATAGCVRWADPLLILWTVEAGTVKQRISTDEGTTFGMPTSIGAGTQTAAVISPQRVRYIYRRSGATIVAQIRDAADNVLVADTTVVASGVDDKSIDAVYRPFGDGSYEIVLAYIASGVYTEVKSPDGLTFS